MIASISCSSFSLNFSPRPENTLMPLSWNGLWEAEMTRPASKPSERVRKAIAGVGSTPALVIVAPCEQTPRASARSSQTPDSRVSRPTMSRSARACSGIARTSAAPSRSTVRSSSG
jgi:hypothetical protein